MDFDLYELLRRARVIAGRVHAGQVDLGGQPVIFHLRRVEDALALDDIEGRIVAALHDAWEDNPGLRESGELQAFLPRELLAALYAITRQPGENYRDYIGRVIANPIARRVKLADLTDNMDMRRLGRKPNINDFQRLQRYIDATVTILTVDADIRRDQDKNSGAAIEREAQRWIRREIQEGATL